MRPTLGIVINILCSFYTTMLFGYELYMLNNYNLYQEDLFLYIIFVLLTITNISHGLYTLYYLKKEIYKIITVYIMYCFYLSVRLLVVSNIILFIIHGTSIEDNYKFIVIMEGLNIPISLLLVYMFKDYINRPNLDLTQPINI